jgi:hypothetical protein
MIPMSIIDFSPLSLFPLTSIRSHNDNGAAFHLQGSVQKREALDIEHMHLIDEQHARYDLCFSLFSPLGHLGINLLPHFLLDLTGITSEEGEETGCLCFLVSDCLEGYLYHIVLKIIILVSHVGKINTCHVERGDNFRELSLMQIL